MHVCVCNSVITIQTLLNVIIFCSQAFKGL